MAYTYTDPVSSTGNPAIRFRMGYEVVSQGIVDGEPQSTINVVLQAQRTNSSTTNKQSAATTMTIDGATNTKSLNFNVGGYTQNTWYTIWTISNQTITHDTATGQKSISLAFDINLSGTSATRASHTWTGLALPTIPMGSTLSLNATSYTISSSNPTATATIHKYNTGYYHKLIWYLGTTQIAYQNVTKASSNPENKTYTLTAAAWLPSMPNATSASGSCVLRTYSDKGYSNQVGVDSVVNFTVVCTKTPTATISVSPSGGISNQWIGGFVSAVMSATATPAETGGSTIAKYEYLINGSVAKTNTSSSTTNSWTSGILNAGSYTFGVRVTDSRGLTATATTSTTTVESYANPSITNISIFRSNGSGQRLDTGTSIYIKAKATATGTGNSITTFKAFTKLSTASSWTDKGTIDKTGTNASEFSGYPNTNSYNVKLEATDALGVTSTYTTTINTASYTMDFKVGGLGVAFGKVAEEDNLLDSAWDIKSAGNIQAVGQFRGKSVGSYNIGKVILVPHYSFTNLGVPSGNDLTYWTAWMKKVCEDYPNLTNTLFIGGGYPSGRGMVLWYVYNTSAVDAEGLPQFSRGYYVPYTATAANQVETDYFGTGSYTPYYIPTWSITSSAQTIDGLKTFASGSGVRDASSPIWYFFRTNGGKLGNIFALGKTVNSKTVMDRMYFREYSHDSTTGDPIEWWDNYRLPSVAANKTTTNNYEILTSKSKVTIAQGGTGQGAPSTVSTGVVSSVSGATLSVQNARKWGKVCDLYLEFNAGTVAGNGNITATVASGYIPALAASGCGYWSQSPFIAQLDSSGNLNIRNASGTSRTFSTTSPLRIALSYQIA